MKRNIQDDVSVIQADLGPGGNNAAPPPSTRNVYLVISMGFGVESPPCQAFLDKVAASVPATDLTAVLYPESVLPHARRYAAECDTVVITGISIVLSPDFCDADAFEAFVGLVGRHDLELLDCLPQNLETEQLSSLGERLRQPQRESGRVEPLAVMNDWSEPRCLLRLLGFRCTTIRDRRKATKSFIAK